MMYKNDLLKTIALSCVLLLTLFLNGCGGGGDDDSTEVTVTASRTEGIAPVTVSFDVQGVDDADINSISWDFGDGTGASTSYLSDGFSVSHTYTTAGTHTVTAYVYTWSDGTYTGLARINVLPDVNLVVSSFAIDDEITPCRDDPSDPNIISSETISAIIQNIGDMALEGTGNIRVGYYLSTDETITVDDIYIGDTTIYVGDYFLQSEVPFGFELLSPSENYQYIHKIYEKCNIPSGSYHAGAIVDYLDEFHWYDFPRLTDTEEISYPCPLFNPAECNSIIWETNEDDNSRVLLGHQVTVSNTASCEQVVLEGRDEYGLDQYGWERYERNWSENDDHDDSSAFATEIKPGETQFHNFCDDNSDWLKFEAIQGRVYKIATATDHSIDVNGVNLSPGEADTQLILYDRDASSILLFQDNIHDLPTVDLSKGWPLHPDDLERPCYPDLERPCDPDSEIVWEAEFSGTYFIKVRTTTCDEDKDPHCNLFCDENTDPECDTLAPYPDRIKENTSPDGVGLNTDYTIRLEEYLIQN